MFEKPDTTARKYASIDINGRKALRESGIKEFPGFSEDLKTQFICVLTFSSDSEQIIKNRVVERMINIGDEQGVEFILAGRDYPVHSTLSSGRNEEDDKTREEAFKRLAKDAELLEALEDLNGITIEYKYILLDKNNVILAATDIPAEITNFRRKTDVIYKRYGLEPKFYENILHITIGRMVKIPDDKKSFEKYEKSMIKLRHDISSGPIKAQVSGFFTESVWDFVESKFTNKKI